FPPIYQSKPRAGRRCLRMRGALTSHCGCAVHRLTDEFVYNIPHSLSRSSGTCYPANQSPAPRNGNATSMSVWAAPNSRAEIIGAPRRGP
ncbi:hypothetical protein J6590_031876, partial [Homalodisca vitripennis]